MTLATAIVVGLLTIIVGAALTSLLGFFFIGYGNHLAKPAKVKKAKALGAGALHVLGVLFLAAGPLASLWAGVSLGVLIAGV